MAIFVGSGFEKKWMKRATLFWGEGKPVSLYLILFGGFEVTDANDMTTVSGAANIAAFYAKCLYSDLCFNQHHRDWLNAILENMFVAIVVENKTALDTDAVENVKRYLQHAVQSAQHMFPPKTHRTIATRRSRPVGVLEQ